MSHGTKQTLIQIFFFLFFLYLFFVSIELMSSAFKLIGSKFAQGMMTNTVNPLAGLFIGLLTTSVVQSSSSTTSILVGLVASGMMPIRNAIPIIMGANIGTTITNVIVSLGSIGRKNEFEKAFPGAIVHDFFNIFCVIIFLPLETMTHFLEHSAHFLSDLFKNIGGMTFMSPLQAAVQPPVRVLQSLLSSLITHPAWLMRTALLAVSLILLFFALAEMIKLMRKLIIGRVEGLLHEYLFSSTGRSFLLGLILTATVQSSSATTSIIVPLVGAGILTLEQIFPYVLGANIGTTVTAILASLVTRSPVALTAAFAHMLFNVSGTLVFLPLKALPIRAAKTVGGFMAKRRVLSIVYVVIFFFLIPLTFLFLK